jgi:hypothetical protein
MFTVTLVGHVSDIKLGSMDVAFVSTRPLIVVAEAAAAVSAEAAAAATVVVMVATVVVVVATAVVVTVNIHSFDARMI